MITITDLERKMLENIQDNDFDGGTIWAWAWDCGPNGKFCDTRQASGIISSLSKKGLVHCQDSGDDATITIKDEGREALA